MAAAVAAVFVALTASADLLGNYVAAFNATDDERYANAYPNARAESFLRGNIPLLECPDKDIERTYYFRWWTYRKHVRATADGGWVITEFLPDVSWARTNNTIFCAFGHHTLEGRWLRDQTPIESNIRFWYQGAGRNHRSFYTTWPIHAIWERAKLLGDDRLPRELYSLLRDYYEHWNRGFRYGGNWIGRGPNALAGVEDWREGSELSASGDGMRPLFNASMWREAKILSELAGRLGQTDDAAKYARVADEIEGAMKTQMWSEERQFFCTIDTNGVHETVRELHGYAPWYFGMPLAGCEGAWQWVLSATEGRVGFRSPWGLTSTDMSEPKFGISYSGHACQWNGPIWPFTESVAIGGLAEALRRDAAGPATCADYVAILHEYAAAQQRTRDDGSVVPWIDENQDPLTGTWLARAIHFKQGVTNERGKDYNHSTFCDLVLSGLAGIVAREPGQIEIRPLFPADWDYFKVEGVRYHGQDLSVVWDRTGAKYGAAGYRVTLGGEELCASALPVGFVCPHDAPVPAHGSRLELTTPLDSRRRSSAVAAPAAGLFVGSTNTVASAALDVLERMPKLGLRCSVR